MILAMGSRNGVEFWIEEQVYNNDRWYTGYAVVGDIEIFKVDASLIYISSTDFRNGVIGFDTWQQDATLFDTLGWMEYVCNYFGYTKWD